MNSKKEYIAPTLTVVTFKVEQGFTGSNGLLSMLNFSLMPDFNVDYNNQGQQNWTEDNNSLFGDQW